MRDARIALYSILCRVSASIRNFLEGSRFKLVGLSRPDGVKGNKGARPPLDC